MQPDPFIPAPISAAERARWSPDALEEARTISERWGLALHALVGAEAVQAGGLGADALHRIGCLVGVDRALVVIFGKAQGRAWLHSANAGAAFAGRSPAAVMQEDGLAGLLLVRGILDAMRCGIFAPLAEDAPGGSALRFRIAAS